MKKIKLILTLAIIVIVILGGMFTASKLGFLKLDFLKRDPLSIEKTANVVEEVKKIGEFTSAVYYEEVALQDSYSDGAILGFMGLTKKNEIVLIGKGRVRAGFDLAKLQDGDINVHKDTLELSLPPTEVFDIIMNPSDFTTEYEKGTWSHELTKPIKERAKVSLEQNALNFGILKKAEENGLKRLENLFKTFGFNTVILTIKTPEAEE